MFCIINYLYLIFNDFPCTLINNLSPCVTESYRCFCLLGDVFPVNFCLPLFVWVHRCIIPCMCVCVCVFIFMLSPSSSSYALHFVFVHVAVALTLVLVRVWSTCRHITCKTYTHMYIHTSIIPPENRLQITTTTASTALALLSHSLSRILSVCSVTQWETRLQSADYL